MPIKIADFLDALRTLAVHEPDSVLRINGEPVEDFSANVLYPIAKYGEAFGRVEGAHDPSRAKVFDISTNGRPVEDLPEIRYPYRRPSQ